MSEIYQKTNPLDVEDLLTKENKKNAPRNGQIPEVKDIIGEALPRIGTYKNLDNSKQVVALIDDVSKNNKSYNYFRQVSITRP